MIDGALLRDALISAANNIANHRKEVDKLNVFPVPDGDTGTNMSMTFGAAKREIEVLNDNATVEEVSKVAAAALLRGARGNSGVILSLLFRGMSKGFQNMQQADSLTLVTALKQGVEAAYKAVMKPTEGTILTVARVSAEKAEEALHQQSDISPQALWDGVVTTAEEALATTPELLPMLKEAGVVDSGGKGLVVIYHGMQSVFSGSGIIPNITDQQPKTVEDYHHDAAAEYEGEITFTYCTEFIVLKDLAKADAPALRTYLEGIGDSVVVVEDEEIIKVHLHTDNPGNAMQKALEMGQLTSMKIDNMREQHKTKKRAVVAKRETKHFDYTPVDPSNTYGFVAVAAGEGVEALFEDLGVTHIVSGGQTMNPSTDEILEAIHATPTKTVIVLPNNKNIIMAAEQAEKIADRGVYVLPSTSVPQGLAAMLAFDPDASLADNQMQMLKAVEHVGTGLVTFAVRDATIDGHKIKKGEVLGMANHKLEYSDPDLEKVVLRLLRSLVKKDSSFITLIYGDQISEQQAAKIEEVVRKKLPDSIELVMVNGGQPVYYFMISVE